jgi:hypothetical protein
MANKNQREKKKLKRGGHQIRLSIHPDLDRWQTTRQSTDPSQSISLRALPVFAVNTLFPVRTSTRPLPQPAHPIQSKKHGKARPANWSRIPLRALRVFAVKILKPPP